MNRTLFRGAKVWDGSGDAAYPADVLVEGGRIKTISRAPGALAAEGAAVIEARGSTLMPGLVEGHAHLSFGGAVNDSDLGNIPPEEHLLLTMRNAKTLLDHGFTSAYSAATSKLRLDVVIRNEVNAGRLPGPRIRAASPEITVTGGLGDERKQHMYFESFGMIADGPEEIARAVRLCCREGVDNIKINISGDDLGPLTHGGLTVMRENEVQMAVDVARDFGKKINCHARSADSVKRGTLRGGCDLSLRVRRRRGHRHAGSRQRAGVRGPGDRRDLRHAISGRTIRLLSRFRSWPEHAAGYRNHRLRVQGVAAPRRADIDRRRLRFCAIAAGRECA
jgi:imidazolonepropionase-like amidohydrolase